MTARKDPPTDTVDHAAVQQAQRDAGDVLEQQRLDRIAARDNLLTITQALSAVMRDVRAVTKDSTAPGNIGGFKFRGVDAVVNAVGPALRQHGVIMVPEVLHVERVVSQTKAGNPMMNAYVTTRYTFHGPAGDTITTTVMGEASDAGDKATSKAQSVALRVALLQALMLPTDEPDPDESNYERAPQEQAPTQEQRDMFAELTALAPEVVTRVQAVWPPGLSTDVYTLNPGQLAQARAVVDIAIAEQQAAAGTPGPGASGEQPPA